MKTNPFLLPVIALLASCGNVTITDPESLAESIIIEETVPADGSQTTVDGKFSVAATRVCGSDDKAPWQVTLRETATGRGIIIASVIPAANGFEPKPVFADSDREIRYNTSVNGNVFTASAKLDELQNLLHKKWIGELPAECNPEIIRARLTEQLLSVEPEAYAPKGYDSKKSVGNGKYFHYSTNSCYVNAMQLAYKLNDTTSLNSLARKVAAFLYEKKDKQSIDFHVDHSIFGAMPLEACIDNAPCLEDSTAKALLALGMHYADHQWEMPDSVDSYGHGNFPYERKVELFNQGYSPQTRLWIDDMYMINILQTQAYRATGDRKYIDRAAKEMVLYLEELQQRDGLFFHAEGKNFVWGRGDGWMAAGMPMILQYLPKDHEYYKPILEGYRKMMKSLLKYQRESGLWGQLVTDPDIWEESSCSAMFAFGFIQGIKHGWLDSKTYAPAARKAWIKLCSMLDEYGNLSEVCIGTGARDNREWYDQRPRVNGDPHGQAPMLWICNALL